MGRSGAAPAVAAIAPPSPALRARTLASGLRVVEWSGAEDVFSAALLVGAGPLDDPADLPGLTELGLHAATLGTEADPDDTRPAARALALGGALHTVADGRVVGWVARGPRSAAPQLLELLRDLAAAPSLPASRFELLVAMAREQVETEGLGATGTGIAVAVGTALGLGRPVPLAPTAAMLERVHREDVLRHWRRIARPERAILVMRMPAGVAVAEEVDRVFGAWVADAPLPDEITPCLPLGQTLHRIATSDAAKTRSVALVATAAPGVGDPERGALEALAAWLSERPGGPIERLVGIDEATRARPWILDVGWGGGRGVAVVLSASGGDNADAASNLRGIAELFASQAEGPGLSGDDASAARRAVAGQARVELAAPLTGLIALGTRQLYRVRDAAPEPADIQAMAARWLAPHRQTLVVVGFADLSTDPAETVREAVWTETGEHTSGPAPARCVPLDVLQGHNPVDSTAQPR
jgi:predicted Zn-dependent peptidase